MALIVLAGPKSLRAAMVFHIELGWPAWDLEPDIPEVVRLDVLPCQTPAEAIALCNKFANDPELDWIDPDGWIARPMAPTETFDGVHGIPL